MNRTYSGIFYKELLLLITLIGFYSTSIMAQDPHFSQYYAAPLYLNPALNGLEKDVSFGLNFRSQWNSIDLPYTTSQFSIINPLYKKGVVYKHLGGVGLSLFNDVAGENGGIKTFGFQLSGAYNYSMPHNTHHTLSIGTQAGFYQKSINLNNLQWGSQYHPIIGFDNLRNPYTGEITDQVTIPVVNAGVVWVYNPDKNKYVKSGFRSFFGFAASNVNHPDESFYKDGSSRLPILYKVHGGLEHTLVRGLKIAPNFLVMRQNNLHQINIGTYFIADVANNQYEQQASQTKIIMGAWHRFNDSMIFMVGLQSKNVTVGTSFDLNSSNLRYQTRGRGALEISAAYKINKGNGIRRLSTPLI